MPFVSVTRLRLRSYRFFPLFAVHTFRSIGQVKKAPGLQIGSLLPDRERTFWTMTLWDDQASMRAYMTSGSHRTAMPRLLGWCDEASVVHWDQADAALPSWTEADKRMRETGRPSKVRYPSARHASLSYRPPRTTNAQPIRPSSPRS